MRYAVLDFETVDPYISKGYGSGWVFKLNHGLDDFKILGMGVYRSDCPSTVLFCKTKEEIKGILDSYTNLVFHNGMYDVGCLLTLFPDLDFSKYVFYDTMLMMKLYRQDLMSYSLDSCCQKLRLNHVKDERDLISFAWDSGLYQKLTTERTGKNVHTRPDDKKLSQFIKSHMDLAPIELVIRYCEKDVMATNSLFIFLISHLEGYKEIFYSDLLKCTIELKRRGIRVDLDLARAAAKYLLNKENECRGKIVAAIGLCPNFNSPKQLAEFCTKVGVTDFPLTEKGNPSISTEWLEEQTNKWLVLLAEARNANKLRTSFVEKLIEYQGFNNNREGKYGVLYPTHKIMGAVNTGRFTSGGGTGTYELNIQQIPSTRTELGRICRQIFIPDEGETWVSADFGSQESRLQVHYAVLLNSPGADHIAQAWREDPTLSFHSKVAEITGLTKHQAKQINLGLSYGMGQAKLCKSLGLPTEFKNFHGVLREVAGKEGATMLKTYHTLLPFMKHVSTTVNSYFQKQGQIKTLGGRTIKINPSDIRSSIKGFNKLIQGSAADQIMAALVACYKDGLKILCTVHDEINISTKDPEKDIKSLRFNMEQCIILEVPMVAEITSGVSWGDCK